MNYVEDDDNMFRCSCKHIHATVLQATFRALQDLCILHSVGCWIASSGHGCGRRFNYSKEFLRWALQPPGFLKDWHVGIRVRASGKLVAFISAVPAQMKLKAATVPMVDINYLCVHKKLRSKRLAPVLIKVLLFYVPPQISSSRTCP